MVTKELPPEAAAELLADAGVLPRLIKLWSEGAEFELLDPKTIHGENAHGLKVTTPAAHQRTFYLSTDTYKLIAHESVDSDGNTTRTMITEYVQEAGVLIPSSSIIESPNTGVSSMTTNSVEVGVGIYDEYFSAKQATRTAQAE